MLTILLVDDHLLFSECLSIALANMARMVIAGDLRQARALLDAKHRFDLVLLEFVLPDGDGSTLFQHLQRMQQSPPVLMLSDWSEPAEVSRCRELGARGYLHKRCHPDDLCHAIEQVVHQGKECWPGDGQYPASIDGTASRLIEALGITARQLQVLRLLECGYSNRDIADQLGVAECTIKSHVTALLHAFDVKNRNACVKAARRRGLIRG